MCAAISALSGKPDTITITNNLERGGARGAEGPVKDLDIMRTFCCIWLPEPDRRAVTLRGGDLVWRCHGWRL